MGADRGGNQDGGRHGLGMRSGHRRCLPLAEHDDAKRHRGDGADNLRRNPARK
jgi:hypothetical protein